MKKTLFAFAAIGGLAVPIVFVLLGWMIGGRTPGDAAGRGLLHGVQLPLWPMSKLFLDDPSGKHWLYLPLAAVLSNALIYGAVGLLAGWGLAHRAGFVAALVAVLAMLVTAWQGFGSSGTGFAIAAAVALTGLILHHRAAG